MQIVSLVVLLAALLVTGVLGTETRPLFFWPGAALIGVAGVLAVSKWRMRVLFPPGSACLLSVLLFASYIALRAAFSPVAVFAREDLVILAGSVVVYAMTATALSHPRWRLAMAAVLLALVVANLAVGSVHLSGRWDFHVVPEFFRSAGEGRIGGLYPNPNHMAAFLSFCMFLSAGWLVFGRGGAVLKLWLAFITVSMGLGMALTVSRGALLGMGAGVLVLGAAALTVVWRAQRHLFWRLMSGGLVAALLAGAVLWKVNEEYLRGRMQRSPVSSDVRLGIWEAALAQHAESPLLGRGARMFYEGSIQYRSPRLPVYSEEALFAHNEYLQMLADYGWIGAALLTFMILSHYLQGLRFLRWFLQVRFPQTGRLKSTSLGLCVGSLAALTATLIHAVVEFHLHVPMPAMTAAFILGILANPGIEDRAKSPLPAGALRNATKFAMLVAALSLLAGAWFFGRADYHLALAEVAQAKRDQFRQVQELSAAIDLDPAQAAAFYQRGLVRLNQLTADKRSPTHPVLKRAVADLETAVSLNPHSYLYRLALADAWDAQGRHDQALQAIQQALLLAPLHEEPRMALGMHWHRLGKFDEAEMAYLWAGQSRAWNEEGTTRWIDSYRLLLQHAALMRGVPQPRS